MEKAIAYSNRKLGIVAKDLLKQFEPLWQFAKVEGVEPTNNEAERELREVVIYRKICQSIHSENGKRFVESIFSVSATCRKNGVKALEYIRSCIESFRKKLPAPRLIQLQG